MWQKLGKHYPITLEIIPLILVAIAFYIALSNYSSLPDIIPTHFNAQGVADDWSGRNWVFIFPGVSIGLYLLLSFITVNITDSDDPMRFINMPNKKRREDLTETQVENLRVFLSRSLLTMKVLFGALAVYGVNNTVEIAMEKANTLGAAFSISLFAILGFAVFMVWKTTNISNN